MNLDLTKVNLKWIKDLNTRPETVESWMKIQGKSSLMLFLAMIFLHMTPKAKATKAKISQWDYINLKNGTAKETIKKIKRQPKEWEKYVPVILIYLQRG